MMFTLSFIRNRISYLILELTKNLALTVTSDTLFSSKFDAKLLTFIFFVGFGWTDEDVYGALRALTASVQDPMECVQAFGMIEWHYAFACAASVRSDVIAGTCPGDGGAPVEYNGKAIGFINTIKGDACNVTTGQPIFFHKLSEYADWIQSVTGIDPS